jgi:hypothetical protein
VPIGTIIGDLMIGPNSVVGAQLRQGTHVATMRRLWLAGCKDVFAEMVETGGDPAQIVEAKGPRQVTDTAAIGVRTTALCGVPKYRNCLC